MEIRSIIISIAKYVILVAVNFVAYCILNSLGIIGPFNKDLIPLFSMENLPLIILLVIIIVLIILAFQRKISTVNITIKRHEQFIKLIIFVLGIFIWQRCIGDTVLLLHYCIGLMLLYVLIECETCKTFEYEISETNKSLTSYMEKPVAGRKILTSSQVEALDQIIYILDNRTSRDSFNIALIGAWGSGKTSVTNTLISELDKRENNNRYFVLKINTQVFNETYNIVEYVNKYFNCLFRKYGITFWGAEESLAYFSEFAEMLRGESTGSLTKIWTNKSDCNFSDIETERVLFSKKVEKLLIKSKRKNIIFIVDDGDRGETKKEVLKLLAEYSSIGGIINIVSLNKSLRGNIWPMNKNNDMFDKQLKKNKDIENDLKYDFFDKYIHMEVKIGDSNNVESERSITNQIIDTSKNIKKNGLFYVSCIDTDKARSLFDLGTDYGTHKINPGETYVTYGAHNMLIELFHNNLEKNDCNFGIYFESIVKEYFSNCKEFKQFFLQKKSYSTEEWNEIMMVLGSWGLGILGESTNWFEQINGNAVQYFYVIGMLIDATKKINSAPIDVQGQISDICDMWEYYMSITYPVREVSWDNRDKSNRMFCNNSNFIGVKRLILTLKENEQINCLLVEKKHDAINDLLSTKCGQIANLILLTTLIIDFIDSVRSVMNNYRLFKMQIRDAELSNLYYLDYLIKNWHPTEKAQKRIEELKANAKWAESIQFNWPSLNGFVDTILYSKYITAYESRFVDGKLKDVKAWILHGTQRNLLVVTGKESDDIKHFTFNTEGERVDDLSKSEEINLMEQKSAFYS